MNYPTLILIAADSIERLRACDVFRVLDSAPPDRMQKLSTWIGQQRPELRPYVAEALAEIRAERGI
jgi:hypothetical protein